MTRELLRLLTLLTLLTLFTPRGFGWRIHCGVEVTVLSTNKQHSLWKKGEVENDFHLHYQKALEIRTRVLR